MRCHFTQGDDEMNSSTFGIWTSESLQSPNLPESVLNINVSETSCSTDSVANLCVLECASPSLKRKILDCESGDFEERYNKIQRRILLEKGLNKAGLIVDDEESSDDEDDLSEQMDWIEKEASESSSSDDDRSLIEYDQAHSSVLFIPRTKLKDERRRLLRISIAKINCVEDSEAYLRRSVLINNTVRKLQDEMTLNYACHPLASTSFQENNAHHKEASDEWNNLNCKQNQEFASSDFPYGSARNDTNEFNSYSQRYKDECSSPSSEIPCSANSKKEVSCSPKSLCFMNQEDIHTDGSYYNGNLENEQQLTDEPLANAKQPLPLNNLSSQPCGFQCRNVTPPEDPTVELKESSNSIVIDSVVYSSLMATLETA